MIAEHSAETFDLNGEDVHSIDSTCDDLNREDVGSLNLPEQRGRRVIESTIDDLKRENVRPLNLPVMI
jgi:hypothetical protein